MALIDVNCVLNVYLTLLSGITCFKDFYQEDFIGLPGVPIKAEFSYIQYNTMAEQQLKPRVVTLKF